MMGFPRMWLIRPAAALARLLGYGMLGWFWLGLMAFGAFFFLPFVSIPLVLLLFVCFNLARARARQRTGREVVLRLHDTVAMGLPLPQGLRAMANGEKGTLRRRLESLATAAGQGVPLAQALRKSVPEIGLRDLGLIQAGDRAGRLGPTLSRLAARYERPTGLGVAPAYAITFILALIPLMMAVWTLIGPKYVEILRQFDIPVRPSMELLIGTPNFVRGWLGARPMYGVPLWVTAIYCTGILATLLTPGLLWWWADERFDSLQSFFSTLAWKCPVLGRLIRERAWSDACLLLSESLRAGEDLPAALAHLEHAGLPWPAVRRLRLMRGALLAGQAPGQAARLAGLPAAMTGLLGMSGPDLAAMLDEAERLYRLRFDTLAFSLRELAKPVMVLFFGILVGLFAWTCIDGQVQIIRSLANTMFDRNL